MNPHVEVRRYAEVGVDLEGLESDVLATVRAHGFVTRRPEPNCIEIIRGSMLRARLLGAWWSTPESLPIKGLIKLQRGSKGLTRLEVVLYDDMRWLYFDRWVRHRYESALSSAADMIVKLK
jgi:hypothetical protein